MLKRKSSKSANPLFEKWLAEWRDEAAMQKKDSLTHCFTKALNNLKKYPLPLARGKDCIILQYFGKKLCAMLDKRLDRHLNPEKFNFETFDSDDDDDDLDDVITAPKQAKPTKKLPNNNNVPRKKKAPKAFIPKTGSACHALLTTLYRKSKNPNYPGFMTKADLQFEAQPFADCSLNKSQGDTYYTGWSSMSTLTRKGLVIKRSNPAKYSITEAGETLAKALIESEVNNLLESLDSEGDIEDNLQVKKPIEHALSSFALNHCDNGNHLKVTPSTSKVSSYEKMDVIEINDFEWEPKTLNSVSKSSSSESLSEILKEIENAERKEMEKVSKSSSENLSQILKEIENAERKEMEKLSKSSSENLSQILKEIENAKREEMEKVSKSSSENLSQILKEIANAERKEREEIDKVLSEMESNQQEPKRKRNEGAKRKETEKRQETQESEEINSNSESIFFLEPNSFDVILLVDTQETSGKAKQKHDATIAELKQFSVQFEVRHLKVGDFAWIARCRKTNNELILPHIVERKRMDDLDRSIQDGRFHEQKFRMKQSGLKNLIYLVESYGKNERTCIPLKSLLQASINSLVQDGFIVKYTNDHRHSINYLSILTNMLREVYSGKRLSSGEKKDLNSIDLCNDSEPMLEFKKFNKSSSKVKTLKVKEMFVRQLLQIKGISVEKALAIVEVFPTPKLLYTALNNPDNDGENFLASLQYGISKRQIGPATSKIIYQLYTSRELN